MERPFRRPLSKELCLKMHLDGEIPCGDLTRSTFAFSWNALSITWVHDGVHFGASVS